MIRKPLVLIFHSEDSLGQVASRVKTSRADVIWNYIGTVVSMAGNFFLLPLLAIYLTSEELGLWYVFVAVSNLAMLFEFGFNPTFSRNIVYVMSGARRLTKYGCDFESVENGVDWRLLHTVIVASKFVYAGIAIIVLMVLATVGTWYISIISVQLSGMSHWVSWVIFCLSVFFNLYFLYTNTLLRGFGDIAGENRAKTFARLFQLVLSAILLIGGSGLIGASLGFLANGLLIRLLAKIRLRQHVDVIEGLKTDNSKVSLSEIRNVLSSISYVAWRDGCVQLAAYASTQAMSITASLTLGLGETGTYSIMLQLGNAVCNFAAAYPKSFFPAFQSAYAIKDTSRQKQIVSTGLTTYWLLFAVGTIGVALVVSPLISLFKSDYIANFALLTALCAYLGLWNQHSIACNFIIGMNEIPYIRGYIVAAMIGVILSFTFSGALRMGAWGLVFGQGISQLLYNNWRWPAYLARKLDSSYFSLINQGVVNLRRSFTNRKDRKVSR